MENNSERERTTSDNEETIRALKCDSAAILPTLSFGAN